MIKTKVGFIVYGVHKDGLLDPMGTPFIDSDIIDNAKHALVKAGMELVEHELIIASKKEARDCFDKYKKMNDVDAVILFSGTWVWASHLIGAIRDFANSGKGIVVWTNPGSQGWRPVGGLVMLGAPVITVIISLSIYAVIPHHIIMIGMIMVISAILMMAQAEAEAEAEVKS